MEIGKFGGTQRQGMSSQSMQCVWTATITAKDHDHLLTFNWPESANAIDVGLCGISYTLLKDLTVGIHLPN